MSKEDKKPGFDPVANKKLNEAIQHADAAEVAAEAERRQADPTRPQAVGFFSGWVEGGEDGQPVEFMVTAYGDLPREGTKLYAQPPRDVLMAAMRAAVAECAEICDVYSTYKGARCASEIRHPIMSDKLAAIADHYAARLPVEMHSTDLNDRKAAEIIKAQGFTATGYVLSGPDGRYALCNGGAVRWLDKADYRHTMFPGVDHSPVPVPRSPNEYGLNTPYFARWLNRIINKLNYYRPDDFARELGRMAAAADKTALLQDQLSGAVAQEGTDQ